VERDVAFDLLHHLMDMAVYCDAAFPAGMKPREYTLDHGKAPDHSGAIQADLEKTHGFTGCLW
jgi:hypothetical protein